MKTVACALLLASAAALAPTPARTAVSKAAPKPALHYQVAAAATAFAPLAALAGGQSEGTGLSLGIDDPREGTVLWVIGGFFFFTYYNWAKEQPDSDSDFFAEYDELLMEELEGACRELRREWSVAHEGRRSGYADAEDRREREARITAAYKPADAVPPGAAELRICRIFKALDDYMGIAEGMRFMEYIRLKCAPAGSVFAEGRGLADACRAEWI